MKARGEGEEVGIRGKRGVGDGKRGRGRQKKGEGGRRDEKDIRCGHGLANSFHKLKC